MDQIVTLETARLAGEVGFNGKVLHFYNHGENKLIPITLLISPPTPIPVEHLETTPATLPVDCVPAPTQTDLLRWLMEKYNLVVTVQIDNVVGYYYEIYTTPNIGKVELVANCWKSRVEYIDTMENALQEACKIVKDRRENE